MTDIKFRLQPLLSCLLIFLFFNFELCNPSLLWADASEDYLAKIADLDIEALTQQSVSTITRKEQSIAHTAAAVYVINNDDIRRLGATSLPDVLRLVPGLNVARINSHSWAITTRGFNGLFSNKLLVLIDGRTVYNPLFGGVYWDAQQVLLEDIERIEVIRGPGGALWGANSVQGIINIVSKHANQTLGGLATVAGGNELNSMGSFRWGQEVSPDGFMRVYGMGFTRDDSQLSNGKSNYDEWQDMQGGFRFDQKLDSSQTLTLQGDIYDGREQEPYALPSLQPPFTVPEKRVDDFSGANFLGRWNDKWKEGHEQQLQVYFDRTNRNDRLADQKIDTYDIDYQNRITLTANHDLMWGAGYRFIDADLRNNFVTINPQDDTFNLYSVFLQDEITLIPEKLSWILGAKLDHNDFTGYEVQPNTRLIWSPKGTRVFWGAISRAVKHPTLATDRVTSDVAVIPGTDAPPTLLRLVGNPDIQSEDMLAYELGYREVILPDTSLDLNFFINDYKHLAGIDFDETTFETTPTPEHFLIPLKVADDTSASSYGAQLGIRSELYEWWRLDAGYSYIHMDIDYMRKPGQALIGELPSKENPSQFFTIRSAFDLSQDWDLDAILRYNDSLPDYDINSQIEFDLHVGWRARKNLQLKIGAQDLLRPTRKEFGTARGVQTERAIYGKVEYTF